ncbi:hypothetical protein FACS189454_05970 [Planctomycetales bacterium]|nr:hypothetical protein FACS189454_05970 [Planctomycetales bacterium]
MSRPEIPQNVTLEDLTRILFTFIANEEKREAERAAADKERLVAEEKRAAEYAAAQAEYAAAQAEYAAADEKRRADAERRWQKLEKKFARTDKQLGDLHNKFGRMEEIYVVPSVIRLLNIRGYDFKERATYRNYVLTDSSDKILTEIDAVIDNCATTALLEVKTTAVRMKDIEHHVHRLQIYRANCVRKGIPVKELIGVIAGLEFENEVRDAAIQAGFFVVVPDGKRLKFDVPDGFKAKTY